MVKTTDTGLVEFWTEFIDWSKRKEGEGTFIVDILRKHECTTVFDACLGDGYDSIMLLQHGFKVTSNELDPQFKRKAIENAQNEGIELTLAPDYDWRSIPDHLENQFDAVICLGNSLTYLFDQTDQMKAITNFYKVLKSGGVFIVDQRNYDYMLDNRETILKSPQTNFRYLKQYRYCSQTIDGFPVKITDDEVLLRYVHRETGQTEHLRVYPFRKKELRALLQQAGFTVETYCNFQEQECEHIDFYQHTCVKRN